MTKVALFIEYLKTLPPDAEVKVLAVDSRTYGPRWDFEPLDIEHNSYYNESYKVLQLGDD